MRKFLDVIIATVMRRYFLAENGDETGNGHYSLLCLKQTLLLCAV